MNTDANTPIKNTNVTSFSALKKEFSVKLGVPESGIKNELLYQFIKEWYAAPYKYGGKTKLGIDCSGFSSVLYQAVFKKQLSASSKNQYNDCKKTNKQNLKEGDLVFFNTNGKDVSHVGVYLQNNKFVHASTSKGVIINDLNEAYYKKYFVAFGFVN